LSYPAQYLYLPAAIVLKRWTGETASQVYVHVDESLHGMEVRGPCLQLAFGLVSMCQLQSTRCMPCAVRCKCMCGETQKCSGSARWRQIWWKFAYCTWRMPPPEIHVTWARCTALCWGCLCRGHTSSIL